MENVVSFKTVFTLCTQSILLKYIQTTNICIIIAWMSALPHKLALHTCAFKAKWCHDIPLGKGKDYTVSTNCSKQLLKIRRLLISSPWDSHPLIKSRLLLVVVGGGGANWHSTPLHEKVNKYVFTSWKFSRHGF